MGYEHSTIAGFRSAISAYHDHINGIPIEKESRISDLLAGVYNIRPPQPRYTFIWDVKKVIDFLATWNSPGELILKDLTLKLAMLLALTSVARASEIGFLNVRYLIKYSCGYTFYFGRNTKTSKRSKPRDPVKFHIFRENQILLCLPMYWFIPWKEKGNTRTKLTAPVSFCKITLISFNPNHIKMDYDGFESIWYCH